MNFQTGINSQIILVQLVLLGHPVASSMAIDSKVAFANRALELGITEAEIDALKGVNITSYATYAYCCNFQLGQADDAPLTAFLTTTLGAEPSASVASKFRRLFFEAHALSLEDLKSRAERSESSEARVIPLAEKMDRIRLQKERLAGISFTPQSEPSHSLIDKVCQQLDDNVVSYIELQKCTSRQDETLHAKTDTALSLDLSGSLKLSKRQKLEDTNVTGEHRLRQAFLRRNLAYDLAGIGTFSVMDLWTQKLFEKMNEAPLANYRSISAEQILNADKALWVKLSNETRGQLQPKTGDPKAFDTAFQKFSEHPEVLQHMCPLQSSASSRPEQGVSFPMQQKEKVNISQKAKANMAKANQRRLVLGFKFQTIVRFLSTANNCASVGRLDDALRRSSQERDAWLVIICVGKRGATKTTRAMSAQSDTCKRSSSWISPLHILWRMQLSPCNQ